VQVREIDLATTDNKTIRGRVVLEAAAIGAS